MSLSIWIMEDFQKIRWQAQSMRRSLEANLETLLENKTGIDEFINFESLGIDIYKTYKRLQTHIHILTSQAR